MPVGRGVLPPSAHGAIVSITDAAGVVVETGVVPPRRLHGAPWGEPVPEADVQSGVLSLDVFRDQRLGGLLAVVDADGGVGERAVGAYLSEREVGGCHGRHGTRRRRRAGRAWCNWGQSLAADQVVLAIVVSVIVVIVQHGVLPIPAENDRAAGGSPPPVPLHQRRGVSPAPAKQMRSRPSAAVHSHHRSVRRARVSPEGCKIVRMFVLVMRGYGCYQEMVGRCLALVMVDGVEMDLERVAEIEQAPRGQFVPVPRVHLHLLLAYGGPQWKQRQCGLLADMAVGKARSRGRHAGGEDVDHGGGEHRGWVHGHGH